MCFTMCELDNIKAKLETLLGLKLRTNLIKEDPVHDVETIKSRLEILTGIKLVFLEGIGMRR